MTLTRHEPNQIKENADYDAEPWVGEEADGAVRGVTECTAAPSGWEDWEGFDGWDDW